MIAYIMDKENLMMRDYIAFNDYEIKQDIDYGGVSQVQFFRRPHVKHGDYIVMHDDAGALMYTGFVHVGDSAQESEKTAITVYEMPNMFNVDLFATNEDIQRGQGVEDFIAATIEANFIHSQDAFMNLPYLTVEAVTHTPVERPVTDDADGKYNFLAYLKNAFKVDGICLSLSITNAALAVRIRKMPEVTIDIDARLSDVREYDEIFEADPLSKITIKAKDTGGLSTYYLRTDGEMTRDPNDEERAAGKSGVSTASTAAEVEQAAKDAFAANKYQHRIEMEIAENSRVIPVSRLFVGAKARIMTRQSGLYETMVTERERTYNKSATRIKCGNLSVTLLEKLRKER